MVSDTWSTDVLASDSEIVEQQEKIVYSTPAEQAAPVLSTTSESMPQAVLDVSETASEAWSTDVLASDSERLTEVDTDDTASVARYYNIIKAKSLWGVHYRTHSVSRSDDTARSEIEVEARSEAEATDETLTQNIPRKNSTIFVFTLYICVSFRFVSFHFRKHNIDRLHFSKLSIGVVSAGSRNTIPCERVYVADSSVFLGVLLGYNCTEQQVHLSWYHDRIRR